MIVDMTTGYEMYSLMDGFSGYNQIKIVPKEQEKTAFTCAWGTFLLECDAIWFEECRCDISEGCHYNFP